MENIEITSLVKQAAQGDSAAFGRLYELTGRKIYFTALKLTGSDADAQDILQDSFMTAFQKLPELTSPESFEPWLMRIAVNRCKMQFRSQKTTTEEPEIMESIEDTDLIPEDYVTDRAKRKVIMDIIDRVLTEDQRRTVILFYYSQLSIEEIASVMDCPKGTVLSRLHLARGKIREAVLMYENKSGDRLHMLIPIPVLTRLLDEETKELALPQLAMTGAVGAAATVTKSGGNVMVNTVKAKVIAGIAAGVVAVGGIGAAIVLSSGDDKDSGKKKPATTKRPESAFASTEASIPDESPITDLIDDSREDTSPVTDPAADGNEDRDAQVDEIQQLVDKFLTGVKNGDADAILETIYKPEQYKAIAPDAMSREFAMEATRYFYQEFEWDFGSEANRGGNRSIMKGLEERKEARFYVSYTSKSFLASEAKWVASMNVGDYVEELFSSNSDKAKFYSCADGVKKVTPITMFDDIKLVMDDDGMVKIDGDDFLSHSLFIDDYCFWRNDSNSEDRYYGDLVYDIFNTSLSGPVVREGFVGNKVSSYSCNDELNELIPMLREKDYGKAYDHLMSSDNELIREYIEKQGGTPLKRYGELNDEQKAKVIDHIKNETEIIYADNMVEGMGTRNVAIILYYTHIMTGTKDYADFVNSHEGYNNCVWTSIYNHSEADKLFDMLEPLEKVTSALQSAKVI